MVALKIRLPYCAFTPAKLAPRAEGQKQKPKKINNNRRPFLFHQRGSVNTVLSNGSMSGLRRTAFLKLHAAGMMRKQSY